MTTGVGTTGTVIVPDIKMNVKFDPNPKPLQIDVASIDDRQGEKRSKIICIDKIDKMPKQFQKNKLLNFMESGHIKVDQIRKRYDFKIKGAKVFGRNFPLQML